MAVGLAVSLRNSRLQAIIDAIDKEGDEYEGGSLTIYSGTRPSTGEELDEYDDAVVLIKFGFPFPCGTVAAAVLTFGSIPDAVAIATGTATWARVRDADENFVADMSVTDYLGDGDVRIDDVDIIKDGIVHCLTATISEGNA